MDRRNEQSLMYSLGGLVGGILAGVRTPTQRARREHVDVREGDGVTLRRTVIEEIEVQPGASDPRVSFGSMPRSGTPAESTSSHRSDQASNRPSNRPSNQPAAQSSNKDGAP